MIIDIIGLICNLCRVILYYSVTCVLWINTLGPAKSVQIIKAFRLSRSVYIIMYHLGPQLAVWIMQVSTFSSVLINRFHCINCQEVAIQRLFVILSIYSCTCA